MTPAENHPFTTAAEITHPDFIRYSVWVEF